MYRESTPAQSRPHAESIVGQSVLRKEGQAKIMGEAKYVDDLTYPEMLYGKTIRSAIARGIIKEIKFDPSFDWGLVLVADYRDIPDADGIHNDQKRSGGACRPKNPDQTAPESVL